MRERKYFETKEFLDMDNVFDNKIGVTLDFREQELIEEQGLSTKICWMLKEFVRLS